jgi:hypothetical protein
MTSVEWLIDKFDIILPLDFNWDKLEKVFEQAKEMEKQQIIDACKNFGNFNGVDIDDYEQYYNEIYGSKGSEIQGYICPQTKKQCRDECCVSAEDCHIQAGIGVIFDCEQETTSTQTEISDEENSHT